MTVPLSIKSTRHFNPIQDGFFRGCSRLGEGGGLFVPPSLKSVTHTYNDETWHSYTLPKEDPKNIQILCHIP